MTLKYLYVLSAFGDVAFASDDDVYDCPIDSVILQKLGTEHTPWTKMDRDEYLVVQEEIRNKLKEDGCGGGNIVFDFLNW